MQNAIVRIPVTATYRKINGEMTMIAAEYADVSADAIAQLLMRGFGVAIPNNIIGQQ